MPSSNSTTKIQNSKLTNLSEIAELVLLVVSVVGLAASLVFQQSIYAQVPIALSLLLNFVNRQKLQRQLKITTASTFDRLNQQATTTDIAIEQLQIAVKSLGQATPQTTPENPNIQPAENLHSLISAVENSRQRLIILEKTMKMTQSEIEMTSRQFKQRPELAQIETLTTIMIDLQQFVNELPQWGSLQQRQLTELQQKVETALGEVSQEIATIPNRIQEAVGNSEINQNLGSALNAENKKNQNEKIRQKHPRAYVKWSPEEDEKLKNEYISGQQIGELAKQFQRQSSAIRSRLQKLELIE